MVELVQVAWFAVVRLLLIALPFLVAIGALYLLLLSKYDINYYLTEKPPEFWVVVVGAAILLVVMAILILSKIAGWLLALPLVLFEGSGGKQALGASEGATAGHRSRIALWLCGWLVGVGLLSALVPGVIGLIGDVVIPRGSSNVTLLLAAFSAVLLVNGLASFTVAVFTTVLFRFWSFGCIVPWPVPGQLSPAIADRGSLGEKPSGRVPGKIILGATAATFVLVRCRILSGAARRRLARRCADHRPPRRGGGGAGEHVGRISAWHCGWCRLARAGRPGKR